MSITRYAADEQPHHDDRGPWVLYAEHLVAVEAAHAAALDAARDAVAALWIRETVVLDNGDIDEKHVWPLPPAALAAIDALRGES